MKHNKRQKWKYMKNRSWSMSRAMSGSGDNPWSLM